jgi:hypothetical protein
LYKHYIKRASRQTLRKTTRSNILFGMNSCSTSCLRTARSEQDGTKTMQARRSTSIIFAKEVILRRFRNGKRWKKT